MIKNVTIKHEQSLFDVALQYYGDVSKVYDLITLNPWIPSIMYNNLKGKTIQYEEQTNTVANFYNSNRKEISTKFPQFIASYYSPEFLLAIDQAFIISLENT